MVIIIISPTPKTHFIKFNGIAWLCQTFESYNTNQGADTDRINI